MDCIVNDSQPPASAIPGNIGIVRAKVMIWENDPFYARGHHVTAFPFSNLLSGQIDADMRGISFSLNSAHLTPLFHMHDMYICTFNKHLSVPLSVGDKAETNEFIDLVGAPTCESGKRASDRLPGGYTYNTEYEIQKLNFVELNAPEQSVLCLNTGKNVFPHQLWIHIGNIFKMGVPRHPSEYGWPLDIVKSFRGTAFSDEEILGAVIWDYESNTEEGRRTFWPVMVTKQTPGSETPVHWSLEKFKPVFQGMDFSITVIVRKQIDDARDTQPQNEIIDSNWPEYKYLMYQCDKPPAIWQNGISNEAFYVLPQIPITESTLKKDITKEQKEQKEKAESEARTQFWWKYKSYVLIEIGAGHSNHNYFIELVKGRSPRLLHLGIDWDNSKKMQGIEVKPNDSAWRKYKKCRVLSVFEQLSCDELYNKGQFRFSVRNHMGRMIITFQGYESIPWVITRKDTDGTARDFSKVPVPMHVPFGKIRIHGGNISCAINFSPLKYPHSWIIPYKELQAETSSGVTIDDNGVLTGKDMDRRNLFMTFADMSGIQHFKQDTNAVRTIKKIFKPTSFDTSSIDNNTGSLTYNCDTYIIDEIIKGSRYTTGKISGIPLYEIFREKALVYGKGWYLFTDSKRKETMVNGMSDTRNGASQPSTLRIFNLDGLSNSSKNKDIPFAIGNGSDSFSSSWNVGIQFVAGSVCLRVSGSVPGVAWVTEIDSTAEDYTYIDCVTPISNGWRLIVLGGGKPTRNEDGSSRVQPFDVACLTEKITDGWTTEGFTSMNHEAQVSCYIPQSIPMDNQELYRLGRRLIDLQNKAFYVTLSYWWEDGIGERDAIKNTIQRTGAPGDSPLLIQMTGISYGGKLRISANRLFFDFTIKDYMTALAKQFIFNSPFFDAVDSVLAVYELARLAGFDDSSDSKLISRTPLSYLSKVLEKPKLNGVYHYNGERCICTPYDLPGGYATLQKPVMRFQNGESYESAMKKISQLSGKVLYFDRWGVLKFEDSPAYNYGFNSGSVHFPPVKSMFDFISSPTMQSDGSSINLCSSMSQPASHLVYNVINYGKSVEDCINQICIFSASYNVIIPENKKTADDADAVGGFIVNAITFFEQLWNPNEEGFLGFKKVFYQSNGLFGGLQETRNALDYYGKMKYPPSTISFETYGIPGLKGLDIITLDNYLFYITEISHEIDPKENKWWMSISGEWLKNTGTGDFLTETR